MFWLIPACIGFWCSVPCGILLGFACVYGYRAKCEWQFRYGLGVRPRIDFGLRHFDWAPIGLIGFYLRML
jgi:hypothetical protein